MALFEDDFLDEIKSRTDLVKLAARWTKLTQKGREHSGLCPFHREKTGSFTVVPEKGFYHCFGCGAHGNAIDFLVAAAGLKFRDAVEALAVEAGLVVPGSNAAPVGSLAPKVAVQAASPQERDGRENATKRKKAFEIWQQRQPLIGSPAETYLSEARAIPRTAFTGCEVLGFHPGLEYWIAADGDKYEMIGTWPALLAAMQWPDDKFAAVHITYLEPDGSDKLTLYEAPGVKRKAKKVRGLPGGAAIRLCKPAARMSAGEGIETVLSAAVGGLPGWCSYSLDNLAGHGIGAGVADPRDKRRKLPSEIPDMSRPGMSMPKKCDRVTYIGDGDTKDLLMLKAKLVRSCRRQVQLGLEADYFITETGADLNDLLKRDVEKQKEANAGE